MEVLAGPSEVSTRGGLLFDGGEEDSCASSSSSSSSSSIGAPCDDNSEEEDDAVSSNPSGGALGSLDSLEDSLPFKRGLSNYFSGKSKSFGNLSEMSSVVERVKDIEKVENPFNKKRRILLANKWASSSKRASFYTWHNPKSMPLLTLHEDDLEQEQLVQEEEEEQEENHPLKGVRLVVPCGSSSSCCSSSSSSSSPSKNVEDPDGWGVPLPPTRLEGRSNLKGTTSRIRSQSCLSFADLQ